MIIIVYNYIIYKIISNFDYVKRHIYSNCDPVSSSSECNYINKARI